MIVQLLSRFVDTSGFRDRVKDALRVQCAALGVGLRLRDMHISGASSAPKAGAVTLVFASADDQWPDTVEAWLRRRVIAGDHILPVIERSQDATGLPRALASINAFIRKRYPAEIDVDALVDEVLSIAWLRRRKRTVFISYRRTDSEAFARQLYGHLALLGYEVFLDDASIEPGLDFQRALKAWLNDADLVLALMSPNFSNSRWCMEEIAFAQAQSVGMLAVHWPVTIYGPKSSLTFPGFAAGSAEPAAVEVTTPDQRLRLKARDFRLPPRPGVTLADAVLTPSAIACVLAACARQRTLALRQRMENLILQASTLLPAKDRVRAGREFGDIHFTDHDGRVCFVRTLPFRPGPEHVREAFNKRGRATIAGCLYAEFELGDDSRGSALRWIANSPRGEAKSQVWAVCGGTLL